MTLKELAERAESATGPDRELDGLIAVAVNHGSLPGAVKIAPEDETTRRRGWVLHTFNGRRSWHQAPRFTASIDAAMTLVPEGLVWNVMTDFGLPGRARLWGSVLPGQVKDRGWSADGATPALALCAAALRVREADNAG